MEGVEAEWLLWEEAGLGPGGWPDTGAPIPPVYPFLGVHVTKSPVASACP